MNWLSRITGIKPYTITRIVRTMSMIFFYRLATFITIPGINYAILKEAYARNASSFLMFNSISGGALSRMSIMTLNIMPYINATIIMQLLVAASPALKELKRDPMQRKTMNSYSRFLSLFISILHSIGICYILESLPNVVLNPGLGFRLMTILYVSTASLIALWISERISSGGIGNGISIITFFNIIASSSMPVFGFIRQKICNISAFQVQNIFIIGLIIFAIIYTFIFEIAVYNVKVFFKKSSEKRVALVDMPMKLNPVGILPSMFSESLSGPIILFFNSFVIQKLCKMQEVVTCYLPFSRIYDSLYNVFKSLIDVLPNYVKYYTCVFAAAINSGVIGLVVKSCFLIFFAFFCIGFAMDPDDVGYNLRSRGICIVGVREGNQTVKYILKLLNAVSFFGASCLVIVCAIIPFVLSKFNIIISGTSIVIVLSVAIELANKFSSILM